MWTQKFRARETPIDRLADHIGEPRGKARMLKRGNGSSQRCQVVFGHASKIQHDLCSGLRHLGAE
jgi:hypothetical protein